MTARRLRAHERLQLKRLLAEGKLTQYELAAKFGVSQPAISQFGTAHRAEIDAIREDFENEFAGLWVTQKKNRLAIIQEFVEVFGELAVTKREPKAARIVQQFLRQAAEELGALHINVNTDSKVTYNVEGVDPDELT